MDNGSLGAHGDLHTFVTHHGMKRVGSGLYEHHGLVGDLSRFSDDSASWAKAKWHTALHVLHLDQKGSEIQAELVKKRVANGLDEQAARVLATQQIFDKHESTVKGAYHLGPGATTNIQANLLTWNAQSGTLGAVLNLFKNHIIGTGSTAAAASDFFLQTPVGAGSLTGSTNGYMVGTQAIGSSPNIYVTSAVFTASASLGIQEWGLTMSTSAASSRTAVGTPTATTFPDSGAAFATAGTGLQGFIIEISSTAVNTPTTTVMGLITANTATSLTIQQWLTLANATASTPGANAAYIIEPGMLDRKVFSIVNMASGDTLTPTYSLSTASGN